MKKDGSRMIGIDVLRALAIVCVVGGHFFTHVGFHHMSIHTPYLFVLDMIYYLLTSVGVPLFLMLTGYLCCFRKATVGYFPKLLRILCSYLLISVFTYLVLIASKREAFSLWRLLNGLGGFSIIDYAWYINMYLGLFFLIPPLNIVLNAAVNDVANRRAWWWGFTAIVALTSFPGLLNRYGMTIFPAWWENCWVIDYYIFGALIRFFWPDTAPVFSKSGGRFFGAGVWEYALFTLLYPWHYIPTILSDYLEAHQVLLLWH